MTDYEPWAGHGFACRVSTGSRLKKLGWRPIDKEWERWWIKDGMRHPVSLKDAARLDNLAAAIRSEG